MFDYEWATAQHNVNCRLARAVVVPDAIPPERLRRYGAAGKLRRYPGLKEEYYLADFEPDEEVLDELGLDAASRSWSCARRRGVALPPLCQRSLRRSARAPARRPSAVVLPRRRLPARGAGAGWRLHRPRARDRRAVADRPRRSRDQRRRHDEPRGGRARHARLDTTFEGRLGAVDEQLIAEGRMRKLERRADRTGQASHPFGRPGSPRSALLADLLLSATSPRKE
jgi:hypothetical protein